MNITLRPLEENESEEALRLLCSIHGNNFLALAQSYLASMFSNDFRKPSFIIAINENEIIGAASYTEELFTTDVWGISWVGVKEEFRNRGIGAMLIRECLKEIKAKVNKTVTVLLATHPKQTRLYDKLGFSSIGEDHEGGKLMSLTLNKNE